MAAHLTVQDEFDRGLTFGPSHLRCAFSDIGESCLVLKGGDLDESVVSDEDASIEEEAAGLDRNQVRISRYRIPLPSSDMAAHLTVQDEIEQCLTFSGWLIVDQPASHHPALPSDERQQGAGSREGGCRRSGGTTSIPFPTPVTGAGRLRLTERKL